MHFKYTNKQKRNTRTIFESRQRMVFGQQRQKAAILQLDFQVRLNERTSEKEANEPVVEDGAEADAKVADDQ